MRTRHRIPTIFNLSMVDVLCCALGCVILLWLLNVRDARRRAAVAGQSSALLSETRGQLDQANLDVAALRSRVRDAEQQVRDTTALLQKVQSDRDQAYMQAQSFARERAQVARDLELTRGQLADLGKETAALKTQQAASTDLLIKRTEEARALSTKIQAAEKRLAALETLARDNDTRAAAAAKSADALAGRLREAEARARDLNQESRTNRARASLAEERLLLLEKDVTTRDKQLAEYRRKLQEMQQEKTALVEVANRARDAADSRFAGISLTGRRVVFLIDMSGSMSYVDEKTEAPEKWSEVRQTLIRIMRSLPDLEKFQVILFEGKTSFLLGSEDRWLDYDPKTSIAQVSKTLAAIKPKGATNMYDAFEAAFRFRAAGMDTIYLLSDGLPNMGAGLSLEAARKLKEIERSEILSKHVRSTLRSDWNRKLADRPRVRIHTIGFFYESPDVGAFLWALARENDGSFVGMSKP